MFDLYLFNTIVNTLWYLFTILIIAEISNAKVYQSHNILRKWGWCKIQADERKFSNNNFSYIYNFVKFCGQLFSGISHIYKYIYNFRSNRFDIESQNNNVPVTLDGNVGNKTLYQKCKNYISKNYNYYYITCYLIIFLYNN